MVFGNLLSFPVELDCTFCNQVAKIRKARIEWFEDRGVFKFARVLEQGLNGLSTIGHPRLIVEFCSVVLVRAVF